VDRVSLYDDIALRVGTRLSAAEKRSDEIEVNIAEMKLIREQVNQTRWYQQGKRDRLMQRYRELYSENAELFRLNAAAIHLNSIDLNTLSRVKVTRDG